MALDEEVAVSATNLSVTYGEISRQGSFGINRSKFVEGVNEISLSVNKGERVAIIGRNGAGKSTLLKCLAGFIKPSNGSVNVNGRLLFLSGVDPGFDAELTGRKNVEQLALAYGISKDDLLVFTESIKDFTELGEAFERSYKGYSTGMKSKLGFGFISGLRSDILMIDETFGAGDREFKKKSRSRMNAMVNNIPTLIMCSHGLSLVSSICERGVVLDQGRVAFDGKINNAIQFYEKMTMDSINWIEFPYQTKDLQPTGLFFDFEMEFKFNERMRIVIHDNKLRQFIYMEELEPGENIHIDRQELPTHLDCMFKLQQFRDGKWYDASRYVRFSE